MLSLYTRYKTYFFILIFVLGSSVLVWLPYLIHLSSWFGLTIPQADFHYVYRHYDGLLYIIAAKTWYLPEAIEKIKTTIDIPPVPYFAAHLPLYPATITLFAMLFGYLKAMIVSTLFFSILLGWFFYFMVKRLEITKHPLILTFVFLMLPRLLIVRSIGAPESMFMLFILISLYFFEKKQFLIAGLAGGLATMTKTPGILLLPAFGIVAIIRMMVIKKFDTRWLWLGLIPLSFLAVCLMYMQQYGDFFAYFKSGDNIHLVAPYAVFNHSKMWVGTSWLEDILFYFFIYAMTITYLKNSRYKSFFYFGFVFFTAVLFVEHRDIARYSLPLWPLSCITFERFFTSKKFLIASLIILPGIYMYAWNFMSSNVMPVQNWSPFF